MMTSSGETVALGGERDDDAIAANRRVHVAGAAGGFDRRLVPFAWRRPRRRRALMARTSLTGVAPDPRAGAPASSGARAWTGRPRAHRLRRGRCRAPSTPRGR